jgi:hypothetical protein
MLESVVDQVNAYTLLIFEWGTVILEMYLISIINIRLRPDIPVGTRLPTSSTRSNLRTVILCKVNSK